MPKRTNEDRKQPGKITPGTLYHIDQFRKEMGWGQAAVRTARRNGLKVRYLGGRAYVHSDEFFDWLEIQDAKQLAETE